MPCSRIQYLCAFLLGVGCAPSLATMEPARTVPAGHVQLTSSVEMAMPSGELGDWLGHAKKLHRPSSPEEAKTIANTAAALLTHAPAPAGRIGVAYGLSKRFEIGLRTSVLGIGGNVRWQFLRAAPGIYGALSLGATGYLKSAPVARATDVVTMNSFGRQELELGTLVGYGGPNFHFWGGPKMVWSRMNTKLAICMDNPDDGCSGEANARFEGTAAYYGGQIGFAVGHRQWFVAAELTLARLVGGGHTSVEFAGTTSAAKLDLGATVVNPSLGLIFWL